MQTALKRTFASLNVYNFRLYFIGQGISMCGTWMQAVALSLLALQLTKSGTQLGLVVAAEFLPVLTLGMFGGIIADSFNKRTLLFITQTFQGIVALALGLVVVTGVVELWMVYTAACCLGLAMVVDNPSRQTFVVEMVGTDHLHNAITLNATMVNTARVIGPAIGAGLIVTVGIGFCFLVNAATYIAVLIALSLMRRRALHPSQLTQPEPGEITAGLRYVWNTPALRSTLVMMFIIGTFAYEFAVTLPLLATQTLHGTATTYSLMTIALGAGAVLGGLLSAGEKIDIRHSHVAASAVLFGTSILLTGLAPNIVTTLGLLIALGALSVLFISLGNTTLQLVSEPSMRGRVMALWSIAFAGTTPIGAPIIGAITDYSSPRMGLAVGGIAAIIAGLIGYYILRRSPVAIIEKL